MTAPLRGADRILTPLLPFATIVTMDAVASIIVVSGFSTMAFASSSVAIIAV